MRRLVALALALACAPAALAQGTWPQRTVRIVVPYAPGSSPDVLARILNERLATRLGQPVIVENRPGAGGNIGTEYVARAAPDGYTFLVSTNAPLVYNTVMYRKRGYG